jgi:hypothetical protein
MRIGNQGQDFRNAFAVGPTQRVGRTVSPDPCSLLPAPWSLPLAFPFRRDKKKWRAPRRARRIWPVPASRHAHPAC